MILDINPWVNFQDGRPTNQIYGAIIVIRNELEFVRKCQCWGFAILWFTLKYMAQQIYTHLINGNVSIVYIFCLSCEILGDIILYDFFFYAWICLLDISFNAHPSYNNKKKKNISNSVSLFYFLCHRVMFTISLFCLWQNN